MSQNHQRSHNFNQRDNDIFRSMVQKLCNVKQIIGDPGHELTHLLVVIEGEGQLLIMPENVIAHPVFHTCAHQMPPVRDIKIAAQLYQKKYQHQHAQPYDGLPGCATLLINDGTGNIPDDQRHNQRYTGTQSGEKQV